MPRRNYTDSAEISHDVETEVTSHVIVTPEGAHPRGLSPYVLQYYETARAAVRGSAFTRADTPLDYELRIARNDPHFNLISESITRAADKAENEERFR